VRGGRYADGEAAMNFQRGAHESSTATEIAIALCVLIIVICFCSVGYRRIKDSVVPSLYANRVERDNNE